MNGSTKSSVKAAVVEYITKRPGERIFLNDLAKEAGATKKRIQQTIATMRRQDHEWGNDLKVVVLGNIWEYSPNSTMKKVNNKHVYEEVGRTKIGTIVIQDEEGNLYKAVELD